MQTPPIYFRGEVLTDDDYFTLAEEFKIPVTAIEGAVNQIHTKGTPLYSLFQSTIRERVREFASFVSLLAPEEEELAVSLGLKEPIPEPSSPSVALSSGDSVQTPSSTTSHTKNGHLEEPSACILTGAPEEDPDDCTTHDHEMPSSPPPAPKKRALSESRVNQASIDALYEDSPPYTEEELESTAPAPLPERDDITDIAAVALMQAMTHGEGHFLITDDGICTINPASPPSLVHSYQVVQNVIQLGGLSEKVKDKQSWMLGSITSALEDYHGEAFQIGQVCEQTEKAENTIRQAVSVFRKFKDKKYNLSYSHHQEALHIKAPFEVTCLILHKAECYDLSAKNVRSLGSIYKTMEDDTTIRNIRSNQQAHDLIDAYKQAKVNYVVFTEGVWLRITGLAGELPKQDVDNHFPVVLDLKNWVSYANGEKMGDIPRRGLKVD